MLNRICFLLGIGIVLLVVACSSTVEEPNIVIQPVTSQPIIILTPSPGSKPSPTLDATPIPATHPVSELPSKTATPQPSATSFITLTPSPIAVTAAPVPVEAPLVETFVTCQEFQDSTSDPSTAKSEGYILYYTRDELGIQAISLADFSQRQIFESLGTPAYGAELAPDKMYISYHDYGEDLYLLDLQTGQIRPIPFDRNWVLASPNWSQDKRLVVIELTTDKRYFLDPLTLDVVEQREPLGWPEVDYTTTNHLPGSGFLAVDPTETFAIYTEQVSSPVYAIHFVLRNIRDGNELWRNEDVGYEYYMEPVWNENGSQALLVLPETDSRAYTLILSLTTDGKETEIARLTQLPGVIDKFEIRYLEWSPDQRYIHFGLFETIETGPGYILDTDTNILYEICEPNFVQGWWLPGEEGGHLLYLADKENGERTLNLLDVASWQRYEILETDTNFDKQNVVGWTSIETP